VSGATAIFAPVFAARQARRDEAQKFRHERLIRDFDELRGLVDEAAESIDPYINAVAGMESAHSGSESPQDPKLFDKLGPFSEARERARHLKARLLVRLGRDHPVLVAYDRAVNVIGEAGTEVATMIALEQPANDGLVALRPERRLSWYAAYDEFLDAAVQLVGSPIEPLI
jgi:hypothetical protein